LWFGACLTCAAYLEFIDGHLWEKTSGRVGRTTQGTAAWIRETPELHETVKAMLREEAKALGQLLGVPFELKHKPASS
jgi:hypothetical protein